MYSFWCAGRKRRRPENGPRNRRKDNRYGGIRIPLLPMLNRMPETVYLRHEPSHGPEPGGVFSTGLPAAPDREKGEDLLFHHYGIKKEERRPASASRFLPAGA